VISGQSRMMYQYLEPEPEGAICPKRSMPQALHSSPHDTLPVSRTDASIANWLGSNIQGHRHEHSSDGQTARALSLDRSLLGLIFQRRYQPGD
jgi:hypothetical protein